MGRQVTAFSVTPSSLQTGTTPSLRLQFIPSTALMGGSLRLAVVSPVANGAVFAAGPPVTANVTVVGLVNCSGAIGALDVANGTLTIVLPNTCHMAANVSVTVEVGPQFFAANGVAGTQVVISLATSEDMEPRLAAAYTIGMPPPLLFLLRPQSSGPFKGPLQGKGA